MESVYRSYGKPLERTCVHLYQVLLIIRCLCLQKLKSWVRVSITRRVIIWISWTRISSSKVVYRRVERLMKWEEGVQRTFQIGVAFGLGKTRTLVVVAENATVAAIIG